MTGVSKSPPQSSLPQSLPKEGSRTGRGRYCSERRRPERNEGYSPRRMQLIVRATPSIAWTWSRTIAPSWSRLPVSITQMMS